MHSETPDSPRLRTRVKKTRRRFQFSAPAGGQLQEAEEVHQRDLGVLTGRWKPRYREAREGMQKMLAEVLGGRAAPATSPASLTTTTKIHLTDEAPELK